MTLVKASMKVIITTIIAGAFLVAATALHARITPHLIALPRGAWRWLQYGRLYSPDGKIRYYDRHGRPHLLQDGVEGDVFAHHGRRALASVKGGWCRHLGRVP